MSEETIRNYGLRRAAPKKLSQDFAYFGLKKDKDEPEAKKAKVVEDPITEVTEKRGRGRARKSDPLSVEVKKPSSKETQRATEQLKNTLKSAEDEEEIHAANTTLVEEVVPYEGVSQEYQETSIQILDFPIRIESIETIEVDESDSEVKIECEECHKMLKPSSLKQHQKTHLGDRPHGCDLCTAKFTRRGDVERHVRIVHNKDKPFVCHKCPRSFGDKKNLKWHLMNHDKKLFHVCETCGFKFGKKDYYDNHVKYIHPQPSLDYESEEEDYTSIQQIDKSMVLDMNSIAMHSGIPSPKKGHDSLVVELTQPQLQSILEQSESNRIAIVGSDRSVKYLSIAPKNAPQKPSGPQVVSLKALERITNMSTQQIVDLHAPDKNVTDPSQLKAVVIEVAEVEEQQVEEIIVGDGEHFGGSDSSEGAANVEMIEALLDAAETYK